MEHHRAFLIKLYPHVRAMFFLWRPAYPLFLNFLSFFLLVKQLFLLKPVDNAHKVTLFCPHSASMKDRKNKYAFWRGINHPSITHHSRLCQ